MGRSYTAYVEADISKHSIETTIGNFVTTFLCFHHPQGSLSIKTLYSDSTVPTSENSRRRSIHPSITNPRFSILNLESGTIVIRVANTPSIDRAALSESYVIPKIEFVEDRAGVKYVAPGAVAFLT